MIIHLSTNGYTACGKFVYGPSGDVFDPTERTIQHSCDMDYVTCKACIKTKQAKQLRETQEADHGEEIPAAG